MNLTNDTLPPKKNWRAEKGGIYAYITITHSGNFQISKSYEYGHAENERHYEIGNYFRVAEVHKFCDIIKAIFKNRV